MKITYDEAVDAVNITFRKGKAAKTLEIAKEVFLDLDKSDKPLHLEIIGAKEKLGEELRTTTFVHFPFIMSHAKHVTKELAGSTR